MPTLLFGPLASGLLLPLLIASASNSGNRNGHVCERVDMIELNHHYDDLGRHNYDQVIFYEWCPEFKRFHVIAWCLVDDEGKRVPQRSAARREWTVTWHERNMSVQREVKASLFRETWSQIDPERANKRFLEEKHRLSLVSAPKRQLR